MRKFADRVLLLDHGQAVALGEPEAGARGVAELNRDYVREREAAAARRAASLQAGELELPDHEVLGTRKPATRGCGASRT